MAAGRGFAALLGVIWVAWTNPQYQAVQLGSPAASADTCWNLSTVLIYGSERSGPWPDRPVAVLLDTVDVTGRQGMAEQRSLYLPSGSVWSVWTRVRNWHGGTSEEGNLIGVVVP